MSLTESPDRVSEMEHAITHMQPDELFDLLDDSTRNKLWNEFAADYFDAGDVYEMVFNIIDMNQGRLSDLSLSYSRQWGDFLKNRDLLNKYRPCALELKRYLDDED